MYCSLGALAFLKLLCNPVLAKRNKTILTIKTETMKTKEEIAQWIIDNRYPKSENDKVSDFVMYHCIVDDINKNTKPLIEEIEQQKMQCSVYHNDILNLEGEKAGLIDEIADLKSRLELSEQKVKLNYNTAIDLESKLKASGSVNEGLKSDVDFLEK
jgi:hypothetical protein